MKYYLEVLKKYAVFNGRASIKEFWIFNIINLLILLLLITLDYNFKALKPEIDGFEFFGLLSTIYILITFFPNIGVTIRRLHDTNRSGWWFLISFIPVVGVFIVLILLVIKPTKGENKYGLNPEVVTTEVGEPVVS